MSLREKLKKAFMTGSNVKIIRCGEDVFNKASKELSIYPNKGGKYKFMGGTVLLQYVPELSISGMEILDYE